MRLSKNHEDNVIGLDSKSALRWLTPRIASARNRGQGKLVALLEAVEEEIIFETNLTSRCNGDAVEPNDGDRRRNFERT